MTIDLDPDIPAERQRPFLRAEPALPVLAWQIDRAPITSPGHVGNGHIASGHIGAAGAPAGIISRSSIRTAG
jgi:hypothetical protein